MLQGKDFIALMDVFYHIFGAFRMGVADKDLPKIVVLHQANNMGNPTFIQLVKNIIQQ